MTVDFNKEKINNLNTYETILVFSTFFSRDNLNLAKMINDFGEKNNVINFSSIEDNFWKNHKKFIKFEIASEELVLVLLAKYILEKENISPQLKEYFQNLDDGNLSAESNVGEEELEEIIEIIKNKKTAIILGQDLIFHPKINNIFQILKILKIYANIKIILASGEEIISFGEEKAYLDEVIALDEFDGCIIYESPKLKGEEDILIGSKQFALISKIKDRDFIKIKIDNNVIEKEFKLNANLKGTVGILPLDEKRTNFRFKKVKIEV